MKGKDLKVNELPLKLQREKKGHMNESNSAGSSFSDKSVKSRSLK